MQALGVTLYSWICFLHSLRGLFGVMDLSSAEKKMKKKILKNAIYRRIHTYASFIIHMADNVLPFFNLKNTYNGITLFS